MSGAAGRAASGREGWLPPAARLSPAPALRPLPRPAVKRQLQLAARVRYDTSAGAAAGPPAGKGRAGAAADPRAGQPAAAASSPAPCP